MEWFSWFIAICLGSTAILSPYISNRHEIRMKHIKDYERKKMCAIQNYLNAVSLLLVNKTPENINKYYSALTNLYLYIPKDKCRDLDEIESRIEWEQSKFPLDRSCYQFIFNWFDSLGKENLISYQNELPKTFDVYAINFLKSLGRLAKFIWNHIAKVLNILWLKLKSYISPILKS